MPTRASPTTVATCCHPPHASLARAASHTDRQSGGAWRAGMGDDAAGRVTVDWVVLYARGSFQHAPCAAWCHQQKMCVNWRDDGQSWCTRADSCTRHENPGRQQVQQGE